MGGFVCALAPATLTYLGNWTVDKLWLPARLDGVLLTISFFMSLSLGGVALILPPLIVGSLAERHFRFGSSLVVLGIGAVLAFGSPFWTRTMLNGQRIAAYGRLGEAAEPMIAAIHRFESEQGAAPTALAELVPRYIDAVPAWASRLYYRRADHPDHETSGNPWDITV